MTALEQIPDTWDSDRDERFFRITAWLLPRSVVEAASALLASYDDEGTTSAEVRSARAALATPAARTTAPTGRRWSSPTQRQP